MGYIKFESFEKLLNHRTNRKSEIVELILNIGSLREKLNNLEKQTFYFKKGLDSHKKELADLERNYEELRILLNTLSIDETLARITDLEADYEIQRNRIPRGSMLMHSFVVGGLKNTIDHLKSLLYSKSKCQNYLSVDSYLNDPNKFLEIMD